jgi:NADH-quinone oxidoreductase subunit N
MEAVQFDLNEEQIRALSPVLLLCAGILVTLAASAFKVWGRTQRLLGLIFFGAYVYLNYANLPFPDVSILGSSLNVGMLFKLSAIVIGVLAFSATLFVEEESHPEWLPLLMIACVGLSLVVGARDWVSFFIYLETFAMPSYVMASLRLKRDAGFESGLKYLMMGAFSSAIFLLGITLVYGFAGSFDYQSIMEVIHSPPPGAGMGLLYAGFSLIIISIGFKVALAPFHMWAPDVYQSAPAALASFLATAVKFSVFVAAFTAFSQSGIFQIVFLQAAISVFGMLSILVGNLMALRQTNLRRMLAYASVASAGNAAVAFAAGPTALSSIFVYLAVYGLNIVAFFAVIEWSARSSGLPSSSQADLSTLAKSLRGRPFFCILLGVVLFSLVGLPPLPGFFGKYLLLRDLLRGDLFVEAGAILVGSLLALAFYLKIFVPIALDNKDGAAVFVKGAPAKIHWVAFVFSSGLLLLSYFSIVQYFQIVADTSLFLR